MLTLLKILTGIFKVLLWPFKALPQLIGLTFIGIIIGLLAVLIFKYISDQKRMKSIMNRIKLNFTEIILYRDDMRQILHAQKEILKLNFLYFIRTIKPAIPIVAIVLLTLSQLNLIYSIKPISKGEPVTVKVAKSDTFEAAGTQDIELILPDGIKVVTPAFNDFESGVIEWEIKGEDNGEYLLGFKIKPQKTDDNLNEDLSKIIYKKIIIGSINKPFAPHLGEKGFFEAFFNPLENPIPRSAHIKSIDIGYESRSFNILGLKIHWLIAFLIIAIGFGLVFRKLLRVS